jgi:hypothetical protein
LNGRGKSVIKEKLFVEVSLNPRKINPFIIDEKK